MSNGAMRLLRPGEMEEMSPEVEALFRELDAASVDAERRLGATAWGTASPTRINETPRRQLTDRHAHISGCFSAFRPSDSGTYASA